ncbi:MAG: hypothetical protein IJ007_07180 [Oscillospiraceae bacterium]|nr:hypothetical protein [Oscillospiraceae bacterium]
MKLRLRERLISLAVAAGMIISPMGTGVTALSAVAEEVTSAAETIAVIDETEETPSETTAVTEETEETPSETTAVTEETEETPSETTAVTEETEETSSETTAVTEETSSAAEENAEETEEEFVYSDPVIEKNGDIIPYAVVERFFTDEELEQVEEQIVIPSVMAEQSLYSGRYAYDALTSEEKAIYNNIYSLALATHNSSENYNHTGTINYTDGTSKTTYVFGSSPVKVTTGASYMSLYKAFLAVGYDNPQFFWLGHTMEIWGNNSTGIYTSVRLCTENYDCAYGANRQQLKTRFENEVQSVLSETEYYGNDYSKEYFITKYICDKTSYNASASHGHDILGVLLYDEAVCESYAKTFQVFMNALDIPVNYVVGQGTTGGHGWNQVCLDNEWYNYDATWIDSDYAYRYEWFNVTDANFTSHTPEVGFTWVNPTFECTAVKYGYENHASNYISYAHECTINGIEKETLEDALDYIIEMKNSSTEYEIVLSRDVKADFLLIAPYASKVTIKGGSLELSAGMIVNADTVLDTEVITDGAAIAVGTGTKLTLGDNFKGGRFGVISGSDSYLDTGKAGITAGTVNDFAEVSGTSLDIYDELSEIDKLAVEKLSILSNEANVSIAFDGDMTLEMLCEDNKTCGPVVDKFGKSLNIKLITAIKEKNGAVVREYGSVPGYLCILYSNTDITSAVTLENTVDDMPSKLKYDPDSGKLTTYSDMPVILEANGASAGYKTVADAVKAMNDKNADYTVTLASAANADNLTLPAAAKAKSVTFKGEPLTVGNTNLKITADTVFECKVIFSSANGVNITAAAGKNLYLNETEGKIGTISGSSSSALKYGRLTADSVKSFASAEGTELTVLKSMSGVKNCTGILNVKSGASVIITEPDGRLEINAEVSDGKLPSITINSAGENAEIIFTALSDIASGTAIITARSDISDKITVTNTAGGKELGAFYYQRTRNIKAEVADAVTLIVNGTEGRNFPNLELALESVNDPSADYTVRLNTPARAETLALPAASKAKSITFTGEKLTLNVKSLKLSTDTAFECELGTELANGVTASAAAGRTFTVANADENVFNSISGTATSTLKCGTLSVQSLRGFGLVEAENITVSKSMSGVKDLRGRLTVSDTGAVIALDNITGSGEIYAAYENGKLPKITVNAAAAASQLSFAAVADGTIAVLPNGTDIIISRSDISGNVKVLNTTADGKELGAFYYKKSRGIKAEVADAFTLSVNGGEGRNFPNLDLIFETMTDQEADYTVKINTPADIADFAVSKVKAKSVTFTGESLAVSAKSLKVPFDMIVDCEITSAVPSGISVTVSAGKTLTFCNDVIDGTFNTITGSASSVLNCKKLDAVSVKNFGSVNAQELVIKGSTSGIKDICGVISAEEGSSVIIDNVSGTLEIRAAYSNGVLPKITVNNAGSEAEISFAAVSDGKLVSVPNGTAVITAKSDISDKITILSKNSEGKEMNAFYYKKQKLVKAETADALTLFANNGEGRSFPNIELLTEAMTDKTADYTIRFNTDISAPSIKFPKTAKSITLTGGKTLDIGNASSLSFTVPVCFDGITIESGRAFAVSGTADMTVNALESSSITSVKASSRGKLYWNCADKKDWIINAGTLVLGADLDTSENVTVTASVAGNGNTIYVNAGHTIRTKDISAGGLTMKYSSGAAPAVITGSVYGNVKLVHTNAFEEGQQLLTASRCVLSAFTVEKTSCPSKTKEYVLSREASRVVLKPVVIYADNGAERYGFASWSDLADTITLTASPESEWTVQLTGDLDIGGRFAMPKTGTYKKLSITAAEDTDFTVTFTGSIALTGDLTLSNIGLRSISSKGAETAFGISMGKNAVVLENVRSDAIKSVAGTSSSEAVLRNVTVNGLVTAGSVVIENAVITGKVKAMTMLEVKSASEIYDAVNAYALGGEDSVLTLRKGKLVSIGKGGTDGTVVLRYTNADGTTSSFSGKTKIGTCAGEYSGLSISAENGNVSVQKSGTVLYAAVN